MRTPTLRSTPASASFDTSETVDGVEGGPDGGCDVDASEGESAAGGSGVGGSTGGDGPAATGAPRRGQQDDRERYPSPAASPGPRLVGVVRSVLDAVRHGASPGYDKAA